MKKFIILLLSLFSIVCFSAEYANIKGTGEGMTDDEALTAAKKDALEKSVGVFLSSKAVMENYVTISDNIISKSNGFIKTYEVTDKSSPSEGLVRINISASVTDVVDQLVQDEMALKLLLTEMNLPSFAVVVYDNEGNRDDFAESSVKKYLLNKGMRLKNFAEGKEPKYDYLLKGKTDYNFMSLGEVYNIKSMKSLQTSMTLELIDIKEDEIISTQTVSAKKAHISENTAKTMTLTDLGPQIAAYIIKQAVEQWSDRLAGNE
ncbi:MAG: hypothetical protein JXN63_08020 [Candidatus Delongbacteria bacterium]|nr:hypothetical protein [Candidatus Delongbacteria bacterium]